MPQDIKQTSGEIVDGTIFQIWVDDSDTSSELIITSNEDVEVCVGSKGNKSICGHNRKFGFNQHQIHEQYQREILIKSTNKRDQPILICFQKNYQQILNPLKTSTYRYISDPSLTPRTHIPQYYLLQPFTQNLKLQFMTKQGYSLIIPYICPQYNLQNCLESLEEEIRKVREQYRSNYFLALSALQLKQREVMTVDYCERCFMVIYFQGKIGRCQVQFSFGRSGANTARISNQNQETNLQQGRLRTLKAESQFYRTKGLSYTSLGDTELLYQIKHPLENLYYTCTHLSRTYKISLNSHRTLLLNLENPNKPDPITCQFHLYSTIPNSTIYFTNFVLRSLTPNHPYTTKITRLHPAVYHLHRPHNEPHNLYLNIIKCISSPITLTYYYLPDFHAINSRQKKQDEQDKQIEDWVFKRTVRIVEDTFSIQINDKRDLYSSQNIVVEISSDSYAYVEIAVSRERNVGSQRKYEVIRFIREKYEEIQAQMAFTLQFQIPKLMTEKQLQENMKAITSNKPDSIWLTTFCKHILFHSPQKPQYHKNQHEQQQQSQITAQLALTVIVTPHNDNTTHVILTGQSHLPYIGISIKIDDRILYGVVDLSSKVDLFVKYGWVGGVAAGCLGLVGVGVGLLWRTRART